MRNCRAPTRYWVSSATVAGKACRATQLYRQMFNRDLYLLAYGRIYANQGAMTPGTSAETVDGMSEDKIDQIIEAMRHGNWSRRRDVITWLSASRVGPRRA